MVQSERAAITLKDGVVQQGNCGGHTLARISQIPRRFAVLAQSSCVRCCCVDNDRHRC